MELFLSCIEYRKKYGLRWGELTLEWREVNKFLCKEKLYIKDI